MQASVSSRPPLDRNHLGRYVAALFGVVALVCFYQPWVTGTLPAVGESTFTGLELARGDASDRVDEANARTGGAGAVGAGSGLVLPTRIATAAAGGPAVPAFSGASDLALPTRIPTVAANTASGAGSGVAGAGGLTLPTRLPTVSPAAPAAGSAAALALPTRQPAGAEIATVAAATAQAVQTARAGGETRGAAPVAPSQPAEPERLPRLPLYVVPVAAAGLAIFSAIWHRLSDPRDRLFGKWWTVLLSWGGTLGVGYVLYKVATAPASNDLLAPGAARQPLWGLWGTFTGFLLSALILGVAWLRPIPSRSPR